MNPLFVGDQFGGHLGRRFRRHRGEMGGRAGQRTRHGGSVVRVGGMLLRGNHGIGVEAIACLGL